MLLVGGQSRRMGTDKATLMIGGQWLWNRQLGILRELAPDAIWISARARPSWCPEGIEVILDEAPSRGPLSGITAALGRLQTSHLLALAIDMPQMTAEHIRTLWSGAEAGRGVMPVNENWFEPLCAIYPAEASEVARDALTQGKLSLQNLAHNLSQGNRMTRYEIPEAEKNLYLNLNEWGPSRA